MSQTNDAHEGIIIGKIGFSQLKNESDIEIAVANQEEPQKFGGFKLHIPEYQRPYAWREKQVEILLNDLKDVAGQGDNASPYLLGSLIFHKNTESNTLEIVDGQQRLTTLALICHYLDTCDDRSERVGCHREKCRDFLMDQNFEHAESQKNLKNNFFYITRWFERQDNETRQKIKELLKSDKIEFVCIVTPNLDDAFIFFDSANSRGKKLEDYDLIKAYHLREIVAKHQESALPYYAKLFEEMAKDGKYLSFFFEQILTPARLWIRDRSDLVAGGMRIYDEFCQEIPKSFARANRSNQNMGILSSFAGGVDFFIFLQKYDSLLKTLKNCGFYQELEKIGGSGFGYARNLYVMAVMIYLDKFPCGRADYMLLLLARAVFEVRIQKERILQATIRDYAKEVLPLVYFSEFEKELEYSLLVFIGEKDKEGGTGKHDGGKNSYLGLVQGDNPKYSYLSQKIPLHRESKKEKK